MPASCANHNYSYFMLFISMKKIIYRFYLLNTSLFFTLLIISCENKSVVRSNDNLYEVSPQNISMIAAATAILKTGDVVLRKGRGPYSYILANLNQVDKSYSHCGIVVVEHGYPFVYHSIGGEDNPDERMRRDSAVTFFSSKYNSDIAVARYTITDGEKDRLVSVIQAFYAAKPKFDLEFDFSTDDKLYCSEFISKALDKAMNDTSYIKKTYAFSRWCVGIDALYINPHAQIIRKVKFM